MKFCEFGYQHSQWPVSEKCANYTGRAISVLEHVRNSLNAGQVWMN